MMAAVAVLVGATAVGLGLLVVAANAYEAAASGEDLHAD